MISLSKCTRDNLCVDCDDPNCSHAGSIEADCPKFRCDNNHDCENCTFIKRFQKTMREGFYDE